MKYTIKGQSVNEPTLEIGVIHWGISGVRITGKDNEGNTWHILELCPDGTFCRCEVLPFDIGLRVDKQGRIKESYND